MGKVSIALRGWRFDEEEVFDEAGDIRPLEELPEETRKRLIRLKVVAGEPCDCCWLLHERKADCNVARVVYGEPLSEVLLCAEHEKDFLYWFREDVGSMAKGEDNFADLFHEWFAAGNRAPDDYEGVDHVDTDPDELPTPEMDGEVKELEDAIEELDDETLDELGTDYTDVL